MRLSLDIAIRITGARVNLIWKITQEGIAAAWVEAMLLIHLFRTQDWNESEIQTNAGDQKYKPQQHCDKTPPVGLPVIHYHAAMQTWTARPTCIAAVAIGVGRAGKDGGWFMRDSDTLMEVQGTELHRDETVMKRC